MDKKVKIYHYYSPPPSHPETFSKPSLTDTSFFEPLNVLVDKILAGESTTIGDSTRQFFEFGEDADFDIDASPSDYNVDDLTDIDSSLHILAKSKMGRKQRTEGEAVEEQNSNRADPPHTASATPSQEMSE